MVMDDKNQAYLQALAVIDGTAAVHQPRGQSPWEAALWAIVAACLFATANSLCRGDEYDARTRTAAAKVAFEIADQPVLPDAPPNVRNSIKKSTGDAPSTPPADGVCPEEAAVLVSVNSPAKGGSGVFVKYRGAALLLTAAHVVLDLPKASKITAGDAEAKCVLIDKDSDIAVLYAGKHAAIDLADAEPSPGAIVDSWGRDADGKMSNVQDEVVATHEDGGYLNAPFVQCKQYPPLGRSGGGLFRNGKLVAILHARDTQDKFGMWSRFSSIKSILDRVNLTGKRQATVYTGQDVHGERWCLNCEPFRQRIGEGNDEIEVTYSRAVVPSGPEQYPAVRFRDVFGDQRFPSRDGQSYHVVSTASELVGFIERNDPAYVIKLGDTE